MKRADEGDRFGRPAQAGLGSVASREENHCLYREARLQGSKDCPNLPLTLLVEVTSRCNLRCRMCNLHHSTGSGIAMDDRLIQASLGLARTAFTVLPFGLGEPLLDPRIVRIVQEYKTLGVSVGLVSNGMLLSEDVSRGLIAGGLDSLSISIDADDPFLFAQIRRGADLEKVSGNIVEMNRLKKFLHASNPVLSLNVVVQSGNFSQLPAIIESAGKWAAASIAFHPITVHKHIPEIQSEAVGPRTPRWRETLAVCSKAAAGSGINLDLGRLSLVLEGSSPEEVYKETICCPEPFRFFGIRANGDIFPCCNWDVNQPIAKLSRLPEVTVSDLADAWLSPEWRSLRAEVAAGRYPEQCKECMRNFTRPFHDENLAG